MSPRKPNLYAANNDMRGNPHGNAGPGSARNPHAGSDASCTMSRDNTLCVFE